MYKLSDVNHWMCQHGTAIAVSGDKQFLPYTGALNDQWASFSDWANDPANQPTTELTGIYGSEQVEVVEVWEYKYGTIEDEDWKEENFNAYKQFNTLEDYTNYWLSIGEPIETRIAYKLIEKPKAEPLPPVIGEESVEEAAHKLAKWSRCTAPDIVIASFKEGAQWQSTRMYTDKWIRVEDRLPEKSQHVSGCRTLLSGEKYVVPGFWSNSDKVFWSDTRPIEFTHWQPLPSPPNKTNVSAPTFTEQQVI